MRLKNDVFLIDYSDTCAEEEIDSDWLSHEQKLERKIIAVIDNLLWCEFKHIGAETWSWTRRCKRARGPGHILKV
jgi:hypothetical protein